MAAGPQAGATATHTYTTSGPFTVTVTDTAGQANQATASVTVSSAAGGTNLVKNPGFEAGLSGWNTSGSTSVTLTRVSGGHSDSFAAKLTNTGASTTSCTLNDSPNWVTTTAASGGRYAGSLWVRADSVGASLKLRFREYSNSSGALLASPTTTVALSTAASKGSSARWPPRRVASRWRRWRPRPAAADDDRVHRLGADEVVQSALVRDGFNPWGCRGEPHGAGPSAHMATLGAHNSRASGRSYPQHLRASRSTRRTSSAALHEFLEARLYVVDVHHR